MKTMRMIMIAAFMLAIGGAFASKAHNFVKLTHSNATKHVQTDANHCDEIVCSDDSSKNACSATGATIYINGGTPSCSGTELTFKYLKI